MSEALLFRSIHAVLEREGLWRKEAVLLAAVSGGADSVALLYGLAVMRREVGFRLFACYVQHGLRGEASLQDEALVRSLCDSLEVPLHVMSADLGMTMDDPGVETVARERRRQLFATCMESVEADALLTGHHMDDQAETVLLRLMRGAGAKGLGGMASSTPFGRGVMLRPLLPLKKAELQDVLTQNGIPWRHDESNDRCCTPRNALRLKTLPRMETLFPDAARHIAQAADSLREDEACLDEGATALYRQALCDFPGVFAVQAGPLLAAPIALRLRALRRLYRESLTVCGLAPEERELSRQDSLALDVFLLDARPGMSLNLPCGLSALRGRAYLHVTFQGGAPICAAKPPRPVALRAVAGRVEIARTVLELSPGMPPLATDERQVCLPAALLTQCELRTPRAGDEIRPLGAPGSKPLRRFLTDRRIDAPFRPWLPLLAAGKRVLWIPGLVTGEELRRQEHTEPWTLTVTSPKTDFPYEMKE